ncbi:IS982 family transposase [Corynebacterium glutamicum]|uniref:IS982 family transposase n=1 Tax=Corynebacterium TaxID=1716 RepID=UPI0007216DB6|nr:MULTISPECIES: IS982 family transposase [Corynebacterium]ALP49151.1 transposase [Corynebacterium glutamicum]ANR61425.1 putative transposase [[Brevibacterium] flavum ZL-1]ANR64425.1 putative transposase [Corynebacterium glutamicum ZL-6]ANU32663.1 transposase [Corynebacterium glutamicum]APT06405.1 transposase [Corynebacterium glutamicum]
MENDLNTLATALYLTTDDYLNTHPELLPTRPASGYPPRISDAELIALAVMETLLGYTSERRFLRYAHKHLTSIFPYIPQQSGYNKRQRNLTGVIQHIMVYLATSTGLLGDDVWVVDSTPVECGRSRETVKRSDLAGIAEYGYCASHSRFFWGMRLHLVSTLHGLPVGYALTGAKVDERATLLAMLDAVPVPVPAGQVIMADKGYNGAWLEEELTNGGVDLIRPARKGEAPRPGRQFLKPLRQRIESVFDTLKGQLGLEQHGGRTFSGVISRVLRRLLALTTVIWHNHTIGQPVLRSLIAYDH